MKKPFSLVVMLLLSACQQTPQATITPEISNQAIAINAILTSPLDSELVVEEKQMKSPKVYDDVWGFPT